MYVRGVAFEERRPDIDSDFAGIYPWDWVGDDIASFRAIQGGLLVAPILQKLILNRVPIETLDFADKVAKWDIERIIPAHLKVRPTNFYLQIYNMSMKNNLKNDFFSFEYCCNNYCTHIFVFSFFSIILFALLIGFSI